MFKRTLTIGLMFVIATMFTLLQNAPAHASGSAWITDASCNGVTIEGNSTQPIMIANAFFADDPSGINSLGYAFIQRDSAIGHFTIYLPFGPYERFGFPVTPVPVPSYSTLRIKITDYLTLEPGMDESTLGEYFLSVVCPDFGGRPVPSGFEQHLNLCFTQIFTTPSNDKPLKDYVIGYKTTQYAKTTPVQGQDGQLWNELYVDKQLTGYVPAKCLRSVK